MKTIFASLIFALLSLAQQTQTEHIIKCTTAGTANAQTCTPTPAVTALTAGMKLRALVGVSNTGALTLDTSGLGAVSVTKVGGGPTTALVANDWTINQYIEAVHDGARWQTTSGLGNAASGSSSTPVAELTADGDGMYFPFGEPQTQVAGGVMASLRTYIKHFVLPIKASVDTIGFRLHTLGGASAGLTIGIYNSTCSTLLASGNKSSGLNVAGYYSVTFADVALDPGSYYIAWSTDDTTLQLSGAGVGTVSASFANTAPATLQYFYGTASTGSGASITLPASCGTRTAPGSIGVPHIALIP